MLKKKKKSSHTALGRVVIIIKPVCTSPPPPPSPRAEIDRSPEEAAHVHPRVILEGAYGKVWYKCDAKFKYVYGSLTAHARSCHPLEKREYFF